MDPAAGLATTTVPATAAQPAAPRPTTGTDVIPGHAGRSEGFSQAAPPSRIADHDYPNVPDTVAGQQAATAPGTGGPVADTGERVSFKDQVAGHAKKIAGTLFRNDDEKALGEAKLEGRA